MHLYQMSEILYIYISNKVYSHFTIWVSTKNKNQTIIYFFLVQQAVSFNIQIKYIVINKLDTVEIYCVRKLCNIVAKPRVYVLFNFFQTKQQPQTKSFRKFTLQDIVLFRRLANKVNYKDRRNLNKFVFKILIIQLSHTFHWYLKNTDSYFLY